MKVRERDCQRFLQKKQFIKKLRDNTCLRDKGSRTQVEQGNSNVPGHRINPDYFRNYNRSTAASIFGRLHFRAKAKPKIIDGNEGRNGIRCIRNEILNYSFILHVESAL